MKDLTGLFYLLGGVTIMISCVFFLYRWRKNAYHPGFYKFCLSYGLTVPFIVGIGGYFLFDRLAITNYWPVFFFCLFMPLNFLIIHRIEQRYKKY